MEGSNSSNGSNVAPDPTPSSSSSTRSSFSRFHYALVVFGLSAILILFYNIVFLKCCPQHNSSTVQRFRRRIDPISRRRSFDGETNISPRWHSIPSLMYRKDELDGYENQGSNYECSVCLGVFVDGEIVRQLPSCRHYFHTACIDMWLFSHPNCPLCRAAVARFEQPDREEMVKLEDLQPEHNSRSSV